MSAAAFGRALIEAHDLDPIYEMLHAAKLDPATLKRWCLAYWCFYHAGVAAAIAEAGDFYRAMRRADREKWPRGSERRHFRGQTSARTIAFLTERFPQPEKAVDSVMAPSWRTINEAVQKWPGFGSWIGFKVTDMADRVLGNPVDFSDCQLAFYKEPAEGLKLVARQENTTEAEALRRLHVAFARDLAPPDYSRPFGLPEIETVLCKYKSHCKGHYPVGKDKREIRHGLHGWGPLSDKLGACLPR